jgi:hypothetical protein
MALKYKLFVSENDSTTVEESSADLRSYGEVNEYLNDIIDGPADLDATATFDVEDTIDIATAKNLIPDFVEKLDDGTIVEDLRVNWRLSQSCATCRYFQKHPYGGSNMTKIHEMPGASIKSGWCTLRTGRSWISSRAVPENDYINIVTNSLGWKLTHVLMTCDEWKIVPKDQRRKINARVISRVPNYKVKLDGTVVPDPNAKFYHVVPSANHTGVNVIPVTPETRRLTPYQNRTQ